MIIAWGLFLFGGCMIICNSHRQIVKREEAITDILFGVILVASSAQYIWGN